MKKTVIIFSLIIAGLFYLSCDDEKIQANFEDMEQMTIYDYIIDNEEFSSFLQILKKGGIDKTLSAYNPHGLDYTLFLPDNGAVSRFISESGRFSSLDDLLNDQEYVNALSRYHVLNMGIHTNDFPFGAFPEKTLSGDLLTVSFIIETDTSYYKINNQAAVIKPNIETSNGYIHVIQNTLKPITNTTYSWLEQNSGYSIFKAAVDLTGFKDVLNINTKDETQNVNPVTLLVEHDSVFDKRNIRSVNDLIGLISPGSQDYTNPLNPLYNFVGYHILEDSKFMDDFEGVATNYTTYSDIPVNINGNGIDIAINSGKEIFDTIVNYPDTVFIDYVGFYYDASNVITQSGAIHFINQIMKQQKPSPADVSFEFWEEPLLSEYREEVGEYLIDDASALNRITWSGANLSLIKIDDPDDEISVWNDDYLYLKGDFSITYRVPKIVQGKYEVYLGTHAYSDQNALVEVYIDGKKLGGLINLQVGGTQTNPYTGKELGTIDFIKYQEHTVEVRSLIPGVFIYDYIQFVVPD